MNKITLSYRRVMSFVALMLVTGLLLLVQPWLGSLSASIAPPLTEFAPRETPPQILADEPSLDHAAALTELQTTLRFQDKPLNPRAVAALIPWLSDTLPGAIAVDIEGTTSDTNQFYGELSEFSNGRVIAEWTTGDERRFVGYQSVGVLDNGTHALRTWVNTGGSGVFPFLMLVSFDVDTEIHDGEPRQRLIMTRRGEFVLGGGYDGEITVSGNTLTFTPAPNGDSSVTVLVE
mgnify:CR=1 FL=1